MGRMHITLGHDVYACFNNDDAGHAVANARELRAWLASGGAEPARGLRQEGVHEGAHFGIGVGSP